MRTHHSEIDQEDDAANRQPVADDGEGPRVAGVAYEDQAADRTAVQLRPAGKEPPVAAVRTAVAQSAPERRLDQLRAGQRHTRSVRPAEVPPVSNRTLQGGPGSRLVAD